MTPIVPLTDAIALLRLVGHGEVSTGDVAAAVMERIEQTRAAEQTAREAAGRALAERRRQLHHEPHTRDSSPHHDGPSIGR